MFCSDKDQMKWTKTLSNVNINDKSNNIIYYLYIMDEEKCFLLQKLYLINMYLILQVIERITTSKQKFALNIVVVVQ